MVEDAQAEDEEEEENASEALKAIRKRKKTLDLGWQNNMELDKVLDPDASPEKRKAANEKISQLNESYAQIVVKENEFDEKPDIKRSRLENEWEKLEKDKEELGKAEEDRRLSTIQIPLLPK